MALQKRNHAGDERPSRSEGEPYAFGVNWIEHNASRPLARTRRPRASQHLERGGISTSVTTMSPSPQRPGVVLQDYGPAPATNRWTCADPAIADRTFDRSRPTGLVRDQIRRPRHAESREAPRCRLGSADRGRPRSTGPLTQRPKTPGRRPPVAAAPQLERPMATTEATLGRRAGVATGQASLACETETRRDPTVPRTRRGERCHGVSELSLQRTVTGLQSVGCHRGVNPRHIFCPRDQTTEQ